MKQPFTSVSSHLLVDIQCRALYFSLASINLQFTVEDTTFQCFFFLLQLSFFLCEVVNEHLSLKGIGMVYGWNLENTIVRTSNIIFLLSTDCHFSGWLAWFLFEVMWIEAFAQGLGMLSVVLFQQTDGHMEPWSRWQPRRFHLLPNLLFSHCIIYCIITHAVDKLPKWLISRFFDRLVMTPHVCKNQALVPVLSQLNPDYIPSYFCKINFSIILPSRCSLSSGLFPWHFSTKMLCAFLIWLMHDTCSADLSFISIWWRNKCSSTVP
jgi:hypothetical protein